MSDYDKYDELVENGFEAEVALSHLPSVEKKEGSLQVWWCRNFPGTAIRYPVDNLVEALHLYGRLVWHDLQRSDVVTNVGGLEVYEDGEWSDWYNEDMDFGEKYVESFDDLFDVLMDTFRVKERSSRVQ